MNQKKYNIIYKYDGDIVGEAIEGENGVSISLNGRDIGLYDSFDHWNSNSGYSYKLSELVAIDLSLEMDFSSDWELFFVKSNN